jgi:alkylation response protein AidB-like acyl-CoA dehydrogenase
VKIALTDEQQLIQRTAREYAERELVPRAADRDREGTFPEHELRALARLGLLGMTVPDQYGGADAGSVAYALALMELARADASVAVTVSVTNMVAELINAVGSEQQKRTHLPPLLAGQSLCASFALSEPQSGSDAAALTTRAEPSNGGWRLSGTKQWVTSGDRAGLIAVWASTDPAAGHKGITAFLLKGGSAGLSVTRLEDKMGLRGSSTAQLVLDNVEVSQADVLGDVGGGYGLALRALNGGRIGIAAQAVGIARGAIDAAITYARERVAFGVPIAKHQAVGNMLADAATGVDAAELLTLRAAWLRQQGLDHRKAAAMAKMFASEKAVRACDVAIQVHGGYGYTRDFPVERMFRDARVTMIYEGTSEIQRIVVGRELVKEAS